MKIDALIVGGGFYGLYLAEYLAARFPHVLVCERNSGLMQRASYANQARVHNGYHYPRSILTAVRSRANFRRFVEEFEPATDSTFESVYAIGRRFSKTSADQFYQSMRRIEAAIRPAPKAILSLFDPAYIEGVYSTEECVFNAAILKDIMAERVQRAGAVVELETVVQAVHSEPRGAVRVDLTGPSGAREVVADRVFCCAYSQLNYPGAASGLPSVELKHEIAEIALVEAPTELKRMGVTIMDGPFFSLTPFPARGLHALTHVRYTPHSHWYESGGSYQPAYGLLDAAGRRTAFPHMVRDAARYLPSMAGCQYKDSLWEVKTVLPQSEQDDSRPILFRPHFGIPNYHLVMGGKIDNVYDIIDVIHQMLD